jgi:hypothetical protein
MQVLGTSADKENNYLKPLVVGLVLDRLNKRHGASETTTPSFNTWFKSVKDAESLPTYANHTSVFKT